MRPVATKKAMVDQNKLPRLTATTLSVRQVADRVSADDLVKRAGNPSLRGSPLTDPETVIRIPEMLLEARFMDVNGLGGSGRRAETAEGLLDEKWHTALPTASIQGTTSRGRLVLRPTTRPHRGPQYSMQPGPVRSWAGEPAGQVRCQASRGARSKRVRPGQGPIGGKGARTADQRK